MYVVTRARSSSIYSNLFALLRQQMQIKFSHSAKMLLSNSLLEVQSVFIFIYCLDCCNGREYARNTGSSDNKNDRVYSFKKQLPQGHVYIYLLCNVFV